MNKKRKYPAGIQSFESIRNGGYVYVDKTHLIYKMITEGKPYFLSRPRRFGKSLLISTLEAVFSGRRELFEAFTTSNGTEQPQLYIATTDWKWEKHPVLRFDFSAGDMRRIDELDNLINDTLRGYEQQYSITPEAPDTNLRMKHLLRNAFLQTGHRVVVLVDEYDNFILHSLGDKERTEIARQRFQNLFGPLKEMDDYVEFVFVTGISKFSQMGIFSKLNQLTNISLAPMFETICGISEDELTTQLRPDIEILGKANGLSFDEQLSELKQMYDGYHFTERQTDMYNPYSLVNAFQLQMIGNYWFDRGTSSALIDILGKMPAIDITKLENIRLPLSAFDLPLENYDDPLPLLYQSGYLTIKSYQRDRKMFTLGFPNGEVRSGFADCLYQHVTNSKPSNEVRTELLDAFFDFRDNADLTKFIESIKIFFTCIPYQLINHNERHYHVLLYTLLVAFGADVCAEEPSSKGRSDIVLRMPKGIYIIEIKYDDTAEMALKQIEEKGYANKYLNDGRPIIKVGISFSSKERNISEWKVVS